MIGAGAKQDLHSTLFGVRCTIAGAEKRNGTDTVNIRVRR
jgi:hypothetical protein